MIKFILTKVVNAKALPFVFLLLLVCGLMWLGFDYGAKRQEVKELTASLEIKEKLADSLITQLAMKGFEVETLKERLAADSVICKDQNEGLQKLILDIKKDRDYWKDWAGKLETGEFCVEYFGFFKQKKRLVPCKNE